MIDMTELGIGAVVALLVLKEVFSFLKTRNGKTPPPCVNEECQRRIREVHSWVHELVWKRAKGENNEQD